MDAAAGQDLDLAAIVLLQTAEHLSPLCGLSLETAGQHPVHAHMDQHLDGLKRLAGAVKCPVEHGSLPLLLDQLQKPPVLLSIRHPLRRQAAEGDAVRPRGQKLPAFLLHHPIFLIGVAEPGSPWAHHRHHLQIRILLHHAQGRLRRGQAAQQQRAVQLDPSGSPGCRLQGVLVAPAADLHDPFHNLSPAFL